MNEQYKERINGALVFIDENLDKTISLVEVANKSFFSSYHFHRIFRGVMGETVNNYIVRRRLEKSANMLIVKPGLSVTDIALMCGFSSSANFAKAFKKYFGCSATEVRQPKKHEDAISGAIATKYGKSFNPEQLYPKALTSASNILTKVEVKELQAKRLCVLPSQGGYQPEALFETWNQLITWGVEHGIEEAQQYRLAFCFDNPAITPIDKCRYHASLAIADSLVIEPPFSESALPKGKYAIVHVKGSYEQINDAQMAMYSQWLPNSTYEPDNFPMLERYLNDSRKAGYIELELMIKLKPMS